MLLSIRRMILPLAFATFASSAHAQFYKQLYSLKGGSISAGYAGQFTTPLTNDSSAVSSTVSTPTGGVLNQTVTGQQQFTPDTGGLLVSMQIHPVSFAGVEVNYGFFRSSEIYTFNYSSAPGQTARIPESANEATAAYVFHPKHIPLQPFVNVGGGAISFIPHLASNQWRGTGLIETGIDIPTPNAHIAIRIEGRSLIYRNPNFNTPAISSRGWRVTDEPVASLVYRF